MLDTPAGTEQTAEQVAALRLLSTLTAATAGPFAEALRDATAADDPLRVLARGVLVDLETLQDVRLGSEAAAAYRAARNLLRSRPGLAEDVGVMLGRSRLLGEEGPEILADLADRKANR